MGLLERIISQGNIRRAFDQVGSNKGSGGVDGVEIEGFKAQVKKEWPGIKAELQEEMYEPRPVRKTNTVHAKHQSGRPFARVQFPEA